jgi:GAF domain-containing protein
VPKKKGTPVMTGTHPMDPMAAFAHLGQIKLADNDLQTVLQTIADLAKRTIPGIDEVSVTLLRDNEPHTAAFTGEVAMQLDEGQYRFGYGPCLEAAASATTTAVPDMSAEDRWPRWTRQALEHGVGSSLSIGLPIKETVSCALNLYATKPNALDDDAVILAQTFAGYAAVALANAHVYDATASLAQQLQAAMDSRAVIEQAKGIIMGERRCTADEAFLILAKASQDSNRKLRDVATALVHQTGKPPL